MTIVSVAASATAYTVTASTTAYTATVTLPGPAGTWASPQQIVAGVASRDVAASDVGKLITLTSGSAVTLTVPAGLGWTAGQRVDVLQLGAGQVTVTGSGATVNASPTAKLRAQYTAATLLCVASDYYVLLGDLAAT